MKIVSLVGAGGKMGTRILKNLSRHSMKIHCIEVSSAGIANIKSLGFNVSQPDTALPESDLVILAVPDRAIHQIIDDVVKSMKPGALLILLDPAAAYLGQLPESSDVGYFVVHPCHPSVFNFEDSSEDRRDLFGGDRARQAIVCALVQGTEEDYRLGEAVAESMFAPVCRTHRISLDQMAMLEPVMAETLAGTMITLLREAMDQAVANGVPYPAARDFMLGHINVELGIVFGEAPNPFSDAALIAIDYGKDHVLQDGWQKLFAPDRIREQISTMLSAGTSN